ncbi:MAG: sodium:solute symporter [Planctomycetes bacterium]|nr:sodium:solute symporter [Planctomycetota bacterium]
MGEVYWGGVAAVAILFALFLVVGWLASRKVRQGSASDMLVAGRNMPLWIATLTMTATWVDGDYLLGTVEGTRSSLASGIQGGLCFGISLMLGGIFFAKTMRRLEFTTLIDPFEVRFGKHWAAVLFVPAMLGEVIWSASLLVAIGATLAIVLGLDQATAILVSAIVVTTYTVIGGMWSVAWTDAIQLAMIPVGMLAALPFALPLVGGLEGCFAGYQEKLGLAAQLIPPIDSRDAYWTVPKSSAWWDLSVMLMLGGIPWNCYFQRVLSCQTPTKARWHSILASVLTIALTLPPLLLGMASLNLPWTAEQQALLHRQPSLTLPLILREMTPTIIGMLGMAAVVGAVTSSYSASILSAGGMFSWNVYRRLLAPQASPSAMQWAIRLSIAVWSLGAVVLALRVGSVQRLWFFCAELIFVLLFPQLLMALFDPKANRIGSITAFVVSLILRFGGGEPVFGLPAFIPYPELLASWLPGSPAEWYDNNGSVLLPVRILSATAGVILLPVVSRLTNRLDLPRELRKID